MPAHPAVVRKVRIRRSHAARSAETRQKILTAAIACIAEQGFNGASMLRIATRAGVSPGAVQHQFGDKDGIIDAVIAYCIQEFHQIMAGIRQAQPDLERRVHAFTERAWLAHQGPLNRVLLHILLHCPEKTERLAEADAAAWAATFGDLNLPQAQSLAAQRFAFMLLGGIGLESVVVPGAEPAKEHFAVLERTLMDMLHPAGRLNARSRKQAPQGRRG